MADTLGSRICEYRRCKGITQDKLAETMGVSSQAVSKWENDMSCPDIGLLPQLAEYFNVTIDELLRGENSKAVKVISDDHRKDFDKLILKMLVNSSNGDIIKMNVPLCLLKASLEIGSHFIEFAGNDTLKNIDYKSVLLAAESGVIGKLLEVRSVNGDIVEIVIE